MSVSAHWSPVDIDLADIVQDCRQAVEHDAEFFRPDRHPVAVPADRHLAVDALPVRVLPGVPAGKLPGVIDVYIVLDVFVRFPVLSVEPQQQEFTVALAADPARRHAMGEAAIRRVTDVFDYRESARQFAVLFNQLASNGAVMHA